MTEMQNIDSHVSPCRGCEIMKMPDMPNRVKGDMRPLFDRLKQLLPDVSAALPQMMLAQTACEAGHMYRPVGGEELQRNKDGTFTTVLRDENGKITKHVPLEKGSAIEEAAKIGWAITSVAVGQAHMMNIADELSNINVQLNEIKQFAYDKQVCKVEAAIRSLSGIDFSDSANARQMIHSDCRELDEGCAAIYKAMCLEVDSMPDVSAMKITEGWFGGAKTRRPEDAEQRFRTVMRLLPVYLRGMLVLTAINAYVGGSITTQVGLLVSQMRKLVEDCKLRNKVKMVPMIKGVDESPDQIVSKMVEAVKTAEKRIVELVHNDVKL